MWQGNVYLRTFEGQESSTICSPDRDRLRESAEDTCSKQPKEMQSVPSMSQICNRQESEDIVYVREDVMIFPTKKQNIVGSLKLIKRDSVLFFSWLPNSQRRMLEAEANLSSAKTVADVASKPSEEGKYAVRNIPLCQMKSIRLDTPKLSSHTVVLVLKSGCTLPPFKFSSGGARALSNALKQHAVLTKSSEAANTYLINDVEDPLQRSLAALELSDVLVLGQPCLAPSTPQGSQQKGDLSGQPAIVERLREGVSRAAQLANSFLLPPKPGFPTLPSGSCADGRMGLEERAETGVGCFEMVDHRQLASMRAEPALRLPPLTQHEWCTFLDSSGQVADDKALRDRIFLAGVEPSLRREAWKHLLRLFPEGATAAYRQSLLQRRSEEYERIKAQWTSITEKQAARFGKWRERRGRVDKDVQRTDCKHPFFAGKRNPNVGLLRNILLTYSMYNFDLGYCQGMADLASPMLFVMRDEAAAFWCFVALMERAEGNFQKDSTQIQQQLAAVSQLVQLLDPQLFAHLQAHDSLSFVFCYRWLLVLFKREFSFDESLKLWEALWSCSLTPHFHIYICAALLQMQRERILAEGMGLDDLLQLSVQMAGKLDLKAVLNAAVRLVEKAGQAGHCCLSQTLTEPSRQL